MAGEIARSAGEIGNLIADLGAVALAAGDGVVDREHSQDAKRRQGCIGRGNAKTKIEHKAERGGDQHHAKRDEDGADAHHSRPR